MMAQQNLSPVVLNFSPPRRFAEGGLAQKADEVKAAGRNGDTMLVHVNPTEYAWLKKNFGGGVNPKTNLPEFSFWDYLLPIAANVLLPGVGGAIGDAIGGVTGGALSSGITGALGNAAVGAGINALTGGDIGGGALAGSLGPMALQNFGITGQGGMLSQLGINPVGSASSASATPTATSSPTSVGNGMGGISGATQSGGSNVISSLMKAAPLMLAAAALGGKSNDSGAANAAAQDAQSKINAQNGQKLSNVNFNRVQTQPMVDTNYGYGPEKLFFSNNSLPLDQTNSNTVSPLKAAQGTYVKGGGTGTSDSIPAKLSDGEYVIDAQTVSMLGNGSSDAGASKLDKMREEIRKQKGGALAKGKFAPDAKAPLSYIKGLR